MPSFAPCLHEEAAKRPNKKISSCAVHTDVVVLVIPVGQLLRVDELWGWQKSPAIIGVKYNCLSAFFIRSQGAIKHPFSLVVENGG